MRPGRSRAANLIAGRKGANLSDAAGSHRGRFCRRRTKRHNRAFNAAVRAARQPFFVENRTGAGGNVGTEAVVRAPADGYVLLLVAPSHAINATLYDNLSYNFISDIAPVASIIRVPNVMEVNPTVPAKTVPEFIAYANATSGKINMASAGNGSSGHMAGELFKMMTGANMVHVPYRGAGPALIDLIGGKVQVMFDSMASSIEYIKAGKLRALAVTTAKRAAALPDLPVAGDFVPGYEASSWYGFGVPKNARRDVDKLNKEINTALSDPKLKARLADLAGTGSRARRPTSASSSPMKPKSGAR
jgi:tripartite-type tricarboxylate transporter receptor subunit TctC